MQKHPQEKNVRVRIRPTLCWVCGFCGSCVEGGVRDEHFISFRPVADYATISLMLVVCVILVVPLLMVHPLVPLLGVASGWCHPLLEVASGWYHC
jgi:hypothetical protein